MHRVVVDERRWIDERRFLHALNFCMVLPGPEAMQLAVYLGWLMNGVAGGVVAGALFVLPGLVVMALLAAVYTSFGDITWIEGLLFGIQAAVVAIVLQAVIRLARRALRGRAHFALALAAFFALFAFDVPFPIVVIAALIVGWLASRNARGGAQVDAAAPNDDDVDVDVINDVQRRAARRAGAFALVLWVAPLVILGLVLGFNNLLSQEAWLFSKAAVVTFGGAYAGLSYIAQQAVTGYGWLEPRDMVAGLGLAETTPGPLVLVMTFVGYVAAYRAADELGIPAVLAGLTGLLIAGWATFLPSFGFVLLGAPSVERLRHDRRIAGALAAVTAAVVGVIADLALWFTTNVLFDDVSEQEFGPTKIFTPDVSSIDLAAAFLAVTSCLLVFWLRLGLLRVIAVVALAGLLLTTLGWHG